MNCHGCGRFRSRRLLTWDRTGTRRNRHAGRQGPIRFPLCHSGRSNRGNAARCLRTGLARDRRVAPGFRDQCRRHHSGRRRSNSRSASGRHCIRCSIGTGDTRSISRPAITTSGRRRRAGCMRRRRGVRRTTVSITAPRISWCSTTARRSRWPTAKCAFWPETWRKTRSAR